MSGNETSIAGSPEERAKEYASLVIDDFPISDIPYDVFQLVISELECKLAESVDKHIYLAAQILESRISEMKQHGGTSRFQKQKLQKVGGIAKRLEAARNEHRMARTRRVDTEKQIQQEKEMVMAQLAIKHEAELSDFDDKYYKAVPETFRKFSPEYLQLRCREEFMAKAKRYEEAYDCQIQADMLQEIETEQQNMRWQLKADQMRDVLMSKQKAQRDALSARYRTMWSEKVPKAVEQEEQCLRVVSALETRVESQEIVQPKKGVIRKPLPPLKTGKNQIRGRGIGVGSRSAGAVMYRGMMRR